MGLASNYALLCKALFSWVFASVADKQSVDTFPWGVWSMNCFRGNHPHLNGHVYSSIALPTDGKKT